MGRRPKLPEGTIKDTCPPVTTPEVRQDQMIHLAMNLAERQLRDGTASAQVITHFLKLGTTLSQLELEKVKNENRLLDAKANAIDSEAEAGAAYKEALEAFKAYSGRTNE